MAGLPEKIRYIGVNSPETSGLAKDVEVYGKEATEANRRMVAGKTVRLECSNTTATADSSPTSISRTGVS